MQNENNILQIEKQCVGCRSCELSCPLQCIEMKENAEGFYYPLVDKTKCVNCGMCLSKCPVYDEKERNSPTACYALKNRNKQNIMKSASGGAADIATRLVIKKGGVVYGAAYTENLVVKHIEVTTQEDCQLLQSSKYVQSDLGNSYKKVKDRLEIGKIVLFVGTPCQIDGLYHYLGKKYEKLYTIDLICHGVPSPKLLRKYFEYMEKKIGNKINSYNFRSKKKYGWGTNYELVSNKKTITKAMAHDKYGIHFLDGDCYRECCYICKYANCSRVGDLTIGDFWGVYKSRPEFASKDGVSATLINTKKGYELFEEIQQYAEVIKCDVEEIRIKQGNLISPTKRPNARDSFYKHIDEKNYFEEMSISISLKERLKVLIPKELIFVLKKYF